MPTLSKNKQGPIARKLLKSINKVRNQKVIDLAAFSAGKKNAAELQKTVVTADKLVAMQPAHAMYVYVQNQVAIFSELLTQLPELSRLSDIVGRAEDEYMPSAPPMSPIIKSYFFFWAVFDAAVGLSKETIGSCIIPVARRFGSHPDFMRLIEVMQDSRMGLYVVEDSSKGKTRLRELITDEAQDCIVPSGWVGRQGEVWLARVLPPPYDQFTQSVVVTTPYVILKPPEADWLAYLNRTLPQVKGKNRRERYERLMKYGLKLNYWNDYIFEAYANHEHSACFLVGLPDVDESRPHSRVNERLLLAP